MTRTLAVLGTDTGCGKTTLTAALALALRGRGRSVSALKPLATGVPAGEAGEDADLIAAATGEMAHDCVLDTFALPRSPLAAARAENRVVDPGSLSATIAHRIETCPAETLLVEGVGGVLVPLAPGFTVLDLVRTLDLPVLLAARAGLGTINHTALTVAACVNAGVAVAGVVLVDTEAGTEADLADDNAAQVTAQCGVPVLGRLPHLADARDVDALREACTGIDVDGLEARLLDLRGDRGARTLRADRAHLWHPFTQTTEWEAEAPLAVRSALGCRLRTEDGREYVDGIGALWANVHGYGHPGIDAAVHAQLGRVAHSTLLGQTHAPAALLAEELAEVAPPGLERVFFSESGASAVEVALRLVLLAQRHRGRPGRTRLLSLHGAYHGDTAGSVSVGRSDPFHRGLDPLLVEVERLRPPHLVRLEDGCSAEDAEEGSLRELDALLAARGETLAALVVEPRVQGAAGVWTHSDTWLRTAVDRCRAAGLLIVCDEVATGFGRTGEMFASSGAGVRPDVLCVGKGLSGGYLPISATLVGDELFSLFSGPYTDHRTLYYGHTFTGNPLAAAAARASLRAFASEGTLDRGALLAARLQSGLTEIARLPGVAETRRRGVICGIELAAGGLREPFPAEWRTGRRVALAARDHGVVVRPLGDVVVLNPALVMPERDCDQLVAGVAAAIREVMASRS